MRGGTNGDRGKHERTGTRHADLRRRISGWNNRAGSDRPYHFYHDPGGRTYRPAGQTIQFGGANAGTGVISAGAVTNPALYNGNNYQLTFSVVGGVTTYTVTDVTNPAAPAAVAGQTNVAYTSGNAINFNGIQVQVSGAPANGDVFSVSPSTNQSIFSTLSNLINTLKSPGPPGSTSSIRT